MHVQELTTLIRKRELNLSELNAINQELDKLNEEREVIIENIEKLTSQIDELLEVSKYQNIRSSRPISKSYSSYESSNDYCGGSFRC